MRMFFIHALGRSGTRFLSSLLAHDSRAVVHHEPYEMDHKILQLRHAGFHTVADGMLEGRFEQLLAGAAGAECYCEVNSYLRYEVDWLHRRFDPLMIHLVRDGRAFVRSAYVRGLYTAQETDGPIVPHDEDPYASRWAALSRFEKLCWYWTHTNEFLGQRLERLVRFEDVLRDFDLLKRDLLDPAGLELTRRTWSTEIGRPRNTSKQYRLRQALRRWVAPGRVVPRQEPLEHWSRWGPDRTERFWEICGSTMQRFGYARDAGGPPCPHR